jgi:hypothetical protein
VVSWYGATELSFTKEGEGPGGHTKHGRQANEGVCETLFYFWNDFVFPVIFCCAKRRHGYSSGLQLYFIGLERTSLGALVLPTRYL